MLRLSLVLAGALTLAAWNLPGCSGSTSVDPETNPPAVAAGDSSSPRSDASPVVTAPTPDPKLTPAETAPAAAGTTSPKAPPAEPVVTRASETAASTPTGQATQEDDDRGAAAAKPAAAENAQEPENSAKPAKPEKPEQPEQAANSAEPADEKALAATLSAECRDLFNELRRLREAIPRVFSPVFNDRVRPVDELNEDIVKATALSEQFLGGDCGTSPPAALVKVWRGRWLLNRFEEGSLKTILDLAGEALESTASRTNTQCEALSLLADVAFHKERDYEKFRAHARRVLQECPQLEKHWPNYMYTYGESLVLEGRDQEALDFIKQVIAANDETKEFVLYNIVLFEAYYGLGKLEEIEELMRWIQAEYPTRMTSVRRSSLRAQYQQWVDISSFWIGFSRFARGDYEGAKIAFSENIDHIDTLELELRQTSRSLPNVQKVYRDFRSKDLLRILEAHQGSVPPVDLEEVDWATEKKTLLKDCRGKVVVILFRNPKNMKAISLLGEMDRLGAEHDDLVLMTLGFFAGKVSPAERWQHIEDMRKELPASGRLFAGFDGTPRYRIFRGLQAKVGTATLIAYDRQGRLAWYKVDPKSTDHQILRRVVKRLVAEK